MGRVYDPRVVNRILSVGALGQQEYRAILKRCFVLIQAFNQLSATYDAVLCLTVANIPLPISALADGKIYSKFNVLSLRNTYLANFLDDCSITVPMHKSGAAPTGLMLMAPHGTDQTLFSIAVTIERKFS